MDLKKELLVLAGFCLVVVLLSLAGLVWIFAAGMIQIGLQPPSFQADMDGLLLLLVCLSMAGVFAAMLLWIAWDAGWLEVLRRLRGAKDPQAAEDRNPKETK